MKLFKTFRWKHIQKQNLEKYFFYAIGEILLVVIGISLAFQLDNWNDARIKKTIEIIHYKNIKDQIIDDQELIQSQMDFNNHFITEFRYADKIIEANDRSKMDTLGLILRNLLQYSDFDRHGNIYETMVNSGEIKLIRNHHIVRGIRELEEKYTYLNRMESIHYDAVMRHVVEVINPIIIYQSGEIKKPDLVFSYEFQNLLVVLMQIMTEKDKTYQEALIQIKAVNELIDKELMLNNNR